MVNTVYIYISVCCQTAKEQYTVNMQYRVRVYGWTGDVGKLCSSMLYHWLNQVLQDSLLCSLADPPV